MADPSLIKSITDYLGRYSNIDFEMPDNKTLYIFCKKEDGIQITLAYKEHDIDFSEYKLNFNEYCKHFYDNEDSEEIIDLIASCIVGKARLKEYSKNNFPYKWELEIKNDDNEWSLVGETLIGNLNFWTKPQIRYLKNTI